MLIYWRVIRYGYQNAQYGFLICIKDGVKMGLRCMGQNMNDLEKTRDFRRFNASSNSNFGGENRTYGTCMNI